MKKVLSGLEGEPVVPREANTIHVRDFQDTADKPGISQRLGMRIKESLSMDGRLAVVSESEKADLGLEGRIKKYEIQNVQYDSTGRPVAKRLRITVSMKLIDFKKKRTILTDSEIQAFTVFSDARAPVVPETRAMDDVLENLAKRIAAKTMTGWYTEYMTPEEKGKRGR